MKDDPGKDPPTAIWLVGKQEQSMKENESMIKNVLVTGGSGRLGNFVCPYLKSQGYNVVSTDQVPAPKE
ncbi:MAG: hypothetical protein GX153_07695, partial [Clostridiaceae bacterium]|nr:hypothetical protein [Clostridiaceae bacterium]